MTTACRADDIIIDMSVCAIIADTERLNRSTVDAIKLIGERSRVGGVHMMGGLSNIGQQLPPKAADGSDLKHSLENAFPDPDRAPRVRLRAGHALARLCPLADDHYVLSTYRNFLEQTGSNALRAVRKFYRA